MRELLTYWTYQAHSSFKLVLKGIKYVGDLTFTDMATLDWEMRTEKTLSSWPHLPKYSLRQVDLGDEREEEGCDSNA